MNNDPASRPTQLSATANVAARPAALFGIFCSSSTSGTATVYDSATTGTSKKIVDTFNLVAGTWYELPFVADAGIYLVLGGTASVTVGWQPNQ